MDEAGRNDCVCGCDGDCDCDGGGGGGECDCVIGDEAEKLDHS